jgi:hypothetical protein
MRREDKRFLSQFGTLLRILRRFCSPDLANVPACGSLQGSGFRHQMIVCWRPQARFTDATQLILHTLWTPRREGGGHRLGEGD